MWKNGTEFRIPDRKCYTYNPFTRRCSRVIRGEYFYLWASCVCSGPDWDFISMPASCCVRFFGGVGGGEFGDEQTTQSAYMLSAPWAAGLASRAQRCLSDVRLWCLYQNNLVPRRSCVLGALEAMQRIYLQGPKVRSMVFTSSAERRWGPLALIVFFKESAWEF